MITLYRPEHSEEANAIENRFQSMVAAYRVAVVETGFPYLMENDERISGEEAIAQYLDLLEKEIGWSNSLSADACFIDPQNGSIC